jgi:hypothetical protein
MNFQSWDRFYKALQEHDNLWSRGGERLDKHFTSAGPPLTNPPRSEVSSPLPAQVYEPLSPATRVARYFLVQNTKTGKIY